MFKRKKKLEIKNNKDYAVLKAIEDMGVDIESKEFTAGYVYAQKRGK